jgi:hypothetical protein
VVRLTWLPQQQYIRLAPTALAPTRCHVIAAPCHVVLPSLMLCSAGPGKGIGRAIAVRFAEEGGSIVLAGRKAEILEEVCSIQLGRTNASPYWSLCYNKENCDRH